MWGTWSGFSHTLNQEQTSCSPLCEWVWQGQCKLFWGTFPAPHLQLICGWGMFFEIPDLSFSKIDLSFSKFDLSFWNIPKPKYIEIVVLSQFLRLRYVFALLGPEFCEKYLSFLKNLSYFRTWVFRKMPKKKAWYIYIYIYSLLSNSQIRWCLQ